MMLLELKEWRMKRFLQVVLESGCPSVPAIPASRALTTLRRSGKMLGSRGREGVEKARL
jgi:hypothetical protein